MDSSDTSLSEAVLDAVAEHEHKEKTALRRPLYDAVDPESLDSVFRNTRGQVTFEYLGYLISVDHEHTVEITPVEL